MECCEKEEPAMFEVYKRIEWHCTQTCDYSQEKFDDSLFDEMKKLISELTLVQPDKRMKLEKAKEKLIEFESQDELNNFDFLLLKKRFHFFLFRAHFNSTINSTNLP